MSRKVEYHQHIPRRAPPRSASLTLSSLRAECQARGLELAVGQGFEIRSGGAVMYEPRSLADACAWLQRGDRA